jgi:glycosyltransferase involved in cell wall biosynthesis
MVDKKLYKPLTHTEKLRWKKYYNLPLDSFVMLWNGRIAERKRPLDVIISWANAGISGTLWFVGNDENMSKPNEQLLLRMIKEKKLANVVIRKAVPESSMRYVYGCADAFITASSVEGMSNSMIEASSVGLPIIGYNIPGNIDIAIMFKKIGFYLCDFANTDELTKYITQVYNKYPLNYREDREKYLSQVEPSAIVTKYLDFIAKV